MSEESGGNAINPNTMSIIVTKGTTQCAPPRPLLSDNWQSQ